MNPGREGKGKGERLRYVEQEIGGLGGHVLFTRGFSAAVHFCTRETKVPTERTEHGRKANEKYRNLLRKKYPSNPLPLGRLRRYFDPLGMEDVRTKSSLRTSHII